MRMTKLVEDLSKTRPLLATAMHNRRRRKDRFLSRIAILLRGTTSQNSLRTPQPTRAIVPAEKNKTVAETRRARKHWRMQKKSAKLFI
jgi:hypothetical protein